MSNMTDSTAVPAQPSAPSFPDLSSTPASPQEAQAALDTLRNERLAGRVDQTHYLERAEYLQRVIAGEQIAAPNPFPTLEERLERQYEESMEPPADLHGYQLSLGEDGLAAHTAIATAFKAAGIPAMHARVIVDEANRLTRQFKSLEEARPQVDRVHSLLRERWGADFDARRQRIDELLDAMADADPRVEQLIESHPWMIAGSAMAMDLLDRVVQYRETRK